MTHEDCRNHHDNPFCECSTSAVERAALFCDFIDRITDVEQVDEDSLRLMPLGDKGKEPAIQGRARLESEKADLLLMSVDEAHTAIRHGHPGFAIYFGRPDHGTDGLVAVDRDAPDDFPDEEMPDTGLTVMSGSGTDPGHYYYTHDGDIQNAAPAGVGEVRASNYYCVTPGSVHPSGGIYNVTSDGTPAHIEQDDLPELLHPSKTTATNPDGEKIEIPRDPPEDLENAEFTNEIGWSLEEVRERSDKLDSLLSRLKPGGYGGDRSAADAAAVNYLWYWGFDKHQIANILRKYRRYESTERDDYLYKHTIPFATGGERITDHFDEDGNYDPDPMGTLPLARLDALEPVERRRYARRRGIDWPSVEEVRERLRDSILESVEEDDYTVKSAPTGAGKTHTVATEPWGRHHELTGDKPVIHAHRTHEARDQARAMSDDAGVDAYTLKGRKELCPVAAGNHDPDNSHDNPPLTIDGQAISEWLDHKCDRQGLPFSHAHRWAEEELGDDLPCQQGDCECAALGQFDGIPRDDGGDPSHDVIHCTHQFLNVPSLRMHTHIFVDEKPSFGIDLLPEHIRTSVNAYLDYLDAPVDDYNELVAASRTGKDPNAPDAGTIEGITVNEHNDTFRNEMDDALSGENAHVECPECKGEGEIHDGRGDMADLTAYPEHGGATASTTCPECNGHGTVIEHHGQPPLQWYKNTPEAHAMAPAFARAIWDAEESAGGRKHARVRFKPPRWGNEDHDEAGWNRVRVGVVLNENWEVVEAEAVPDFSLADSVIGLDAHPAPADPFWLVNCHPEMETDYTLDQEERTLYRRYERGLFTVQIGEGVQPVTTGEWLDSGQGKKFNAIVDQLHSYYEEDFDAAITSMAAKDHIREAMEDAGIEDPEMMHYGAEESRNDFAGKDVGLVAGSIDPGDAAVINLCARLGCDVDPCYKECPVCEGAGNVHEDGDEEWCETCSGSGEVRERGRTFEGDDADMADAVLQGVREHHVAQSAGRWARDAEDPEDTAMVFIATEAAPEGFIDAQAPGVTWTTNEGQRERLKYVRDQAGGATAREVAEACDCSKRTAQRTLKKAEEEGLLEKTPGSGPQGATVYWPGDEFSPSGAADLTPDEGLESTPTEATATDGVSNLYTYTVSVDCLPHCAYSQYEEQRDEWQYQSSLGWYERASPPPE